MASSLDRVVVSSSDKFAAAGVLLCSPFGVTAAFCAASVCGCVTAGASGGMDQQFLKDFIAGGTSGCIAKCATAPIERRKLVTQLTSSPTGLRLAASLAASADGPVPMPGPVNPWAGNLINCFRYFPTQACNFAFKDAIKAMFPKVNKKENFSAFFAVNMLSGGLAGALSLLFVYPLDFARTLLAIDTHGCYSGAFDSMTTVIAANGGGWSGLTSLYSGFTISCIGIIPFRGTYFGVNDALSSINPYGQERSLRGLFSKFMCAQIAAIAAGAASYPFDTVRRLMQLHAATGHTVSMTEAASISWNEGTLFAGLGANTMRTIGSALVLIAYGEIKEMLK